MPTLAGKWTDPDTWKVTFATLQAVPTDPAVILISGLFMKDGSFQKSSIQHLAKGFLTPDESGDLVVQALSSNNQVVSQVTVKSNFTVRGLAAEGSVAFSNIIDIGAYPLAVVLPDSNQITSVLIKKTNGAIVAKIAVKYGIVDLINAIPATAFRFRPGASRDLLLKEAQNAQNEINLGENKEASRILKLIKAEIASGTKDFRPSITNPLSKADILEMIEQMIKALKEKGKSH